MIIFDLAREHLSFLGRAIPDQLLASVGSIFDLLTAAKTGRSQSPPPAPLLCLTQSKPDSLS